MIVDFRSDTITKPTPAMLQAMMEAEVGDDVFGDDPTILKLERKVAQLFHQEAALFCASGTMANQLAIKTHTQPGGEVICHKNSHIYLYEGGGIALNSGCSVQLLDGENGLLNAQSVEEGIRKASDIHFPQSQLVSLENTMNKGGGACYSTSEIRAIKNVCTKNDLALHLDGARLFNALVAKSQSPEFFGNTFDSISICLSKGLGCPVGSVLVGSSHFIQKARRFRKAMGGGWRQAGYLAAAGIFALDNHVERLAEDHFRAKTIADFLGKIPYVESVIPAETNIVIFQLPKTISIEKFVTNLKDKGILVVPFGPSQVRMVTHLQITDHDMDYLFNQLKSLNF